MLAVSVFFLQFKVYGSRVFGQFLHFLDVGECGMSWRDTAVWENGGHFNDRRPREVEEVRAQGSLRERVMVVESDQT